MRKKHPDKLNVQNYVHLLLKRIKDLFSLEAKFMDSMSQSLMHLNVARKVSY